MRLICARPHGDRPEVPLAYDSFGAWLFDQVLHCFWLRERLIRIGFIDAESEGSFLFWRWDYENAHIAAWIRDLERKQWEHKRDQAIARWGEGAG